MEIAVAALIVFCTVPQLIAIPTEWHLGKSFLAQLLDRSDHDHPHLKPRFDRLLCADVEPRDVVISDAITSWPIPSSCGRIVAALHYEAFVDGQDARMQDVANFFGESRAIDRAAILDRYDVSYILINRARLTAGTWSELLRESAVVRREDDLVLMRADRWRGAGKRELAVAGGP